MVGPVLIKRLHPDAIAPHYATQGAARFDLHAISGGVIASHGADTFRTGLAVEIPPGWELQIVGRSGHGFKHGIRLANVMAVIDSDYRGEILLRLHNDSWCAYTVEAGERIAQGALVQVPRVEFLEVDELSETDRGAGGMGSTGI